MLFIGLRSLLILVLLLGVFFRFANLDTKFYWYDETLTSLTISGYTKNELIQQVFKGEPVSSTTLQKYQQVGGEKTAIDVVRSLAEDFPEHPPLYYFLLRIWAERFGSSIATIRGFSALLSLLVFPALYWLCKELFKSATIAWIAISLVAVSPFYVLYAQEARQYSFWAGAIMLSCAALLRATRKNSRTSWFLYGATIALQLYIYPFSLYLVIGHGIFVAVHEKWRLRSRLRAFLLSAAGGILCFGPWLFVLSSRYADVKNRLDWMQSKVELTFLVQKWAANFCNLFLNFFSYSNLSAIELSILALSCLFLVALVGYAAYFLFRQAPRTVWLFLSTLILPIPIFLLSQDLISGGYRSTIIRYLTPSLIGIQLMVAYLLGTKLTTVSKPIVRRVWSGVFAVLISGGILSCAISSSQEIWWTKTLGSEDFLATSRILNQVHAPLLLIPNDGYRLNIDYPIFLSFSHRLHSDARMQNWLMAKDPIPRSLTQVQEIFLFYYAADAGAMEKTVQGQGWNANLLYKGRERSLWKLYR